MSLENAVTITKPSPEVIQTVNTLMKNGFELSDAQLVPGAQLKDDLGLDSLDAVDMLVYIEEKMGIRIEGERLRAVRTIDDIYMLATDAAAAGRVRAQSNGHSDNPLNHEQAKTN